LKEKKEKNNELYFYFTISLKTELRSSQYFKKSKQHFKKSEFNPYSETNFTFLFYINFPLLKCSANFWNKKF